jgi:hypothetical protein
VRLLEQLDKPRLQRPRQILDVSAVKKLVFLTLAGKRWRCQKARGQQG